jgi:hypothetical protein
VKEFADTLAAIDKPLSNCEVVSYILARLGSEYDSFVTTVTTKIDPIMLDELYGHLMTFESRLEQNNAAVNIAFPSANIVTKTNTGRGSNYNNNRGNFYSPRSRGRGHGLGLAPPQIAQSSSNNARPLCHICGKQGHTAIKCYRRFDHSFQGDETNYMAAYMAAPSNQPYLSWYPDKAATNHMTSDLSNLNLQSEEYNGYEQVRVGNGQGLNIAHIGTSNLLYKHNLCLPHMLHVLKLTNNLIYVHKLARDNNAVLEFHSNLFCIKDKATGAILLQGNSRDGLYPLIPSTRPCFPLAAYIDERTFADQWHRRLGHPSARIVSQVTSRFQLPLSSNKKCHAICNACQLSKSHCLPFPTSLYVSKFPIELVFCDVWGLSPTLSMNKNRYYVSSVDDYSKFNWVFPISAKSDVLPVFIKFVAHVERLFSCKLKVIQTDGGGEFRVLIPYLSKLGISHRMPCPYTRQQ